MKKIVIGTIMWVINEFIDRTCLPLRIECKLYRVNERLNDFIHGDRA